MRCSVSVGEPTDPPATELLTKDVGKGRCAMQRPRMQQTMPEDRSGWYPIDAGPHLEILFHPNRRLAGREPDEIERSNQ